MNGSINCISIKGSEDTDHFMRWLEAEKPRWGALFPKIASGFDLKNINPGGTFLPRIVVGMYLDDTFQQCLREIEHGGRPLFTFDLVEGEVTDIQREQGIDVLVLANGTRSRSNLTVLATGNTENVNYNELLGTSGYFPFHYRHENAIRKFISAHLSKELKVLILGTRLSGIDGAILLIDFIKQNPYISRHKVTLASRDGVIPMLRVPPKPGWNGILKHINPDNIKLKIEQTGGKLEASYF